MRKLKKKTLKMPENVHFYLKTFGIVNFGGIYISLNFCLIGIGKNHEI